MKFWNKTISGNCDKRTKSKRGEGGGGVIKSIKSCAQIGEKGRKTGHKVLTYKMYDPKERKY